MKFHLDMTGTKSFEEMITQGLKCERALIKKGLIKIYNEPKDGPRPHYSNDKSKFWNKNKNIVNDEIVDARTIKIAQPMVKFVGQNPLPKNNTIINPQNQGRNTQQEEPKQKQQNYKTKCTYTPLRELIETILRQLVSSNLVTLPKTSNYEPQVKPPWWGDHEHCEFHQGREHKTSNFHRLKDLVQDLFDRGET